jgi:hypothetical protein
LREKAAQDCATKGGNEFVAINRFNLLFFSSFAASSHTHGVTMNEARQFTVRHLPLAQLEATTADSNVAQN